MEIYEALGSTIALHNRKQETRAEPSYIATSESAANEKSSSIAERLRSDAKSEEHSIQDSVQEDPQHQMDDTNSTNEYPTDLPGHSFTEETRIEAERPSSVENVASTKANRKSWQLLMSGPRPSSATKLKRRSALGIYSSTDLHDEEKIKDKRKNSFLAEFGSLTLSR